MKSLNTAAKRDLLCELTSDEMIAIAGGYLAFVAGYRALVNYYQGAAVETRVIDFLSRLIGGEPT
jgi:hypothetical protein